jgi:hypothetical protein
VVSDTSRIIARALWVLPALLLFLVVNQTQVAVELRATWERGRPAVAEVLAMENTNRADITYDYISIRVPMADGQVLTKEKMSLPHSLMPRVGDQKTLEVRVRPGASQEVVFASLMPAHWLIAAAQAGMSLIGFLILAIGVFWWNRFLQRQGDPALRRVDDAIEH